MDVAASAVLYRRDYAKSRFKVSHMLWQNGRVEASRRNLEQLIREYPKTDTAELAKGVLERF
jgi:TolA-binding protein